MKRLTSVTLDTKTYPFRLVQSALILFGVRYPITLDQKSLLQRDPI